MLHRNKHSAGWGKKLTEPKPSEIIWKLFAKSLYQNRDTKLINMNWMVTIVVRFCFEKCNRSHSFAWNVTNSMKCMPNIKLLLWSNMVCLYMNNRVQEIFEKCLKFVQRYGQKAIKTWFLVFTILVLRLERNYLNPLNRLFSCRIFHPMHSVKMIIKTWTFASDVQR